MEVVKQITKEQLDTLVKQQKELGTLLTNIGVIESQKHGFLHQIKDINKTIEDFKLELQEQYGSVNINLEDGTYTDIKPQVKE